MHMDESSFAEVVDPQQVHDACGFAEVVDP